MNREFSWQLGPDGFSGWRPASGPCAARFASSSWRARAHVAESATAPGAAYRARNAPKARGVTPDSVWALDSPGAPTGNDRTAS